MGVEFRLGAEPAAIGLAARDRQPIAAAAGPPSDDLVGGLIFGNARLHRDPGMDAKRPTPADCAGTIDLNDRLTNDGWPWRSPHRLKAGTAPIGRGIASAQQKRSQTQQQKDQDQRQTPQKIDKQPEHGNAQDGTHSALNGIGTSPAAVKRLRAPAGGTVARRGYWFCRCLSCILHASQALTA